MHQHNFTKTITAVPGRFMNWESILLTISLLFLSSPAFSGKNNELKDSTTHEIEVQSKSSNISSPANDSIAAGNSTPITETANKEYQKHKKNQLCDSCYKKYQENRGKAPRCTHLSTQRELISSISTVRKEAVTEDQGQIEENEDIEPFLLNIYYDDYLTYAKNEEIYGRNPLTFDDYIKKLKNLQNKNSKSKIALPTQGFKRKRSNSESTLMHKNKRKCITPQRTAIISPTVVEPAESPISTHKLWEHTQKFHAEIAHSETTETNFVANNYFDSDITQFTEYVTYEEYINDEPDSEESFTRSIMRKITKLVGHDTLELKEDTHKNPRTEIIPIAFSNSLDS